MLQPGSHVRKVPSGAPFLIKYANKRYRFRIDFEFAKDSALKLDSLFSESCYPRAKRLKCDEKVLAPRGFLDTLHPEGIMIVNCTGDRGLVVRLDEMEKKPCCAMTQKNWFSIGELVLKRVNVTFVLTNKLVERDLRDEQGSFLIYQDETLRIKVRSRTNVVLRVESGSPLTQPYGDYEDFPLGTTLKAYKTLNDDVAHTRSLLLVRECRTRWSRKEDAPLEMTDQEARQRYKMRDASVGFSELKSVQLKDIGKEFELTIEILKRSNLLTYIGKPVEWVGYGEELAKIALMSETRTYLDKIAQSDLMRELQANDRDIRDIFKDPTLSNAIKLHERDRLSLLSNYVAEDNKHLQLLSEIFDQVILENNRAKRKQVLQKYLLAREGLLNKAYNSLDKQAEPDEQLVQLTRPGAFNLEAVVTQMEKKLDNLGLELKKKLLESFQLGAKERTTNITKVLSFLVIEGEVPLSFREDSEISNARLLPQAEPLKMQIQAHEEFNLFYKNLANTRRITETKIKDALMRTNQLWSKELGAVQVELKETAARKALFETAFREASWEGFDLASSLIKLHSCPNRELQKKLSSSIEILQKDSLELQDLEGIVALENLALNCTKDFYSALEEGTARSLENVRKALSFWHSREEAVVKRLPNHLKPKIDLLSEGAREIYEKLSKEKQIDNCSKKAEIKHRFQRRLSEIVEKTPGDEVDYRVKNDPQLVAYRRLINDLDCDLEKVELEEWPVNRRPAAIMPRKAGDSTEPELKSRAPANNRPQAAAKADNEISISENRREEPMSTSKDSSPGFGSTFLPLALLMVILFTTASAKDEPCQLTGSAQASKNIVCNGEGNCTDHISGTFVLKAGMKACMVLNEDFYTFQVTKVSFPLTLSHSRKCYPPRNLANKGVSDVGPGKLVLRDWQVACEVVSCFPQARQEFKVWGFEAWYYRGFFGVNKEDYVISSIIALGEPEIEISVRKNGLRVENQSLSMNWLAATSVRPAVNGHHISYHNSENANYYHAEAYGSGQSDYCSIREVSGLGEGKLEFVNPPPTTLVCGHFTERDKNCIAPTLGEHPGQRLPLDVGGGELTSNSFVLPSADITLTWQSQSESYRGKYDSGCRLGDPKVSLDRGNCQKHNLLTIGLSCPAEVMSNCSLYRRQGGDGYVIPVSAQDRICEILVTNPQSAIKRSILVPATLCEAKRKSTTTVKTAKEIFGHGESEGSSVVQVISTVGQTGAHILKAIPETVSSGVSALDRFFSFLRIGLPIMMSLALSAGALYTLKRIGVLGKLKQLCRKALKLNSEEETEAKGNDSRPANIPRSPPKAISEEAEAVIHRNPTSIEIDLSKAGNAKDIEEGNRTSNLSFNAELLRGRSFLTTFRGGHSGVNPLTQPKDER